MALYRDPQDGRVFVPRPGGGVALNFAHPVSWAILICTTVIPLVVVVVVTIGVLS